MSTSSNDSMKHIEQHKEYYIPGADLHVLVGKVMFRVHGFFFERDSVMFKEILNTPIPPNQTRPGSSDSQPIVIKNSSPMEFAKLCWVFYNRTYSDYSSATITDWTSVLKTACEYKFVEVQHCAIRGLQTCKLSTVERIHVYELYNADSKYLVPLYVDMAMRDEPPSNDDVDKLGSNTALLIFRLREYLRSRPVDGKGDVSPLPVGLIQRMPPEQSACSSTSICHKIQVLQYRDALEGQEIAQWIYRFKGTRVWIVIGTCAFLTTIFILYLEFRDLQLVLPKRSQSLTQKFLGTLRFRKRI